MNPRQPESGQIAMTELGRTAIVLHLHQVRRFYAVIVQLAASIALHLTMYLAHMIRRTGLQATFKTKQVRFLK
jgi:hypothetical protein